MCDWIDGLILAEKMREELMKNPEEIARIFASFADNADGDYEGRILYRVENGEVVSVCDVRIYDARYTLTESGYRAVMQQGAKLNGEVKAGEKE